MAAEFDHLTLSAYMDGELDPQTMQSVERYLDNDAAARRFVIEAMRTTVLLRAGSNAALHEPVPNRLLNVFAPPPEKRRLWPRGPFPAMKLAAALALVVVGVGLGLIFQPMADPSGQRPSFQPLSAYRQVISQSLETHLSGDPLAIDLDTAGARIIITPIKTYRNKDGQYYRGFTMELISDDAQRTYRGMAYRMGKSDWRTAALFMPGT
jgi:hypothetical protein